MGHPNRASRRHRRFHSVAACGSAAAYAGLHAVTNIAPYYNFEHGWPLVYMVRESGRRGEYTFYGPWPWDNPPILEFNTPYLILDVLAGFVLALLVAVCVVYWLRNRPRGFRFSLRGLFATMSVAAVSAAAGVYFEFSKWDILDQTIHGLRWAVFVVPCWLVITAAHWAVCQSVDSKRQFRKCELHELTWIAIVAICLPFLHYAFLAKTDYVFGRNKSHAGTIGLAGYGWPVTYQAELDESKAKRLTYLQQGWEISFYDPIALLADLLVSLVVVVATGFVVERWIRRTERRVPWTPQVFLLAFPALCLLVVILIFDTARGPPWYDYASWLFAVLSSVFAVVLLVHRGVVWTIKKLRPKVHDHSD